MATEGSPVITRQHCSTWGHCTPPEGWPALVGRLREELAERRRCPSCSNVFLQPFVCTTCGAQKLYDATLRAAEEAANRLREERATLAARIRALKPSGGLPRREEEMRENAARLAEGLEPLEWEG